MINYLKFCCEWVDKGAAATLLLLLLVSFLIHTANIIFFSEK